MANEIKRPPREIVEKFRKFAVSDMSDAFDVLEINAITSNIPPVFRTAKSVGPAVTLRQVPSRTSKDKATRQGHVLEDIAQTGDVIVIDAGGRTDMATWGGILSTRAKVKGIAGTVIDGCVRDVLEIEEMKYPVFARGINPRESTPRYETCAINVPVEIGGILVRPGDIVMAEIDGIAVVPAELANKVYEIAEQIAEGVSKRLQAVKEGKTLKEAPSVSVKL